MRVFLADAVKIQTMQHKNLELALKINTAMNELPINDCRLQDDSHDRNPDGARITLSACEWAVIKNDNTHYLNLQANRWPHLSSCGLKTSRGEKEWNDEYTCSGDMTHIGVLPISMGECIEDFCNEATAQVDRREDRKECIDMCKDLRAQWKGIESFLGKNLRLSNE